MICVKSWPSAKIERNNNVREKHSVRIRSHGIAIAASWNISMHSRFPRATTSHARLPSLRVLYIVGAREASFRSFGLGAPHRQPTVGIKWAWDGVHERGAKDRRPARVAVFLDDAAGKSPHDFKLQRCLACLLTPCGPCPNRTAVQGISLKICMYLYYSILDNHPCGDRSWWS